MYCTVLYCTVLYCTVLYCTVLYCIHDVYMQVVHRYIMLCIHARGNVIRYLLIHVTVWSKLAKKEYFFSSQLTIETLRQSCDLIANKPDRAIIGNNISPSYDI
jgi:hypothetical protein